MLTRSLMPGRYMLMNWPKSCPCFATNRSSSLKLVCKTAVHFRQKASVTLPFVALVFGVNLVEGAFFSARVSIVGWDWLAVFSIAANGL